MERTSQTSLVPGSITPSLKFQPIRTKIVVMVMLLLRNIGKYNFQNNSFPFLLWIISCGPKFRDRQHACQLEPQFEKCCWTVQVQHDDLIRSFLNIPLIQNPSQTMYRCTWLVCIHSYKKEVNTNQGHF